MSPVQALVRVLSPQDCEQVKRGFRCLGDETRYHRWGRPVLRAEQVLGWIPELEGGRSFALGACARTNGAPMGLARYSTKGPHGAELALVVVDEWQGRGLGTELLKLLLTHARARGVRHVTAAVMLENRRALALMRGIGAVRTGPLSGTVELAAALPPHQRRCCGKLPTKYVVSLFGRRGDRRGASDLGRSSRIPRPPDLAP